MITREHTILELTEYEPKLFDRNAIPEIVGETLWRNYKTQVAVDFPSPKTEGKWQFTSQGWVGYIPATSELHIYLRPKVALSNLFGMLEYAYRLKSFRFLEGLRGCKSLEEFYEQLATVLARRVLDRGRKGFYREYLLEIERLPFVRGRLNLRKAIQAPWDTKLECHYEEHASDIEDNQILAWTLSRVARSGMCTERVLPTVRRAYRAIQGFVTLGPHTPEDCVGRLYNRLNEDYHPLHALCRFFLENSGPTHEMGEKTMLPFLVDMARLYELFVAEWLKAHLPEWLQLKCQESLTIGEEGTLRFQIDLVLYDAHTGKAMCVLDTKYKTPSSPEEADVSQVVTYAEAKGCKEAILIYPTTLDTPLDERIGEIRVRSLTFSLDSNLEEAGQTFMESLIPKNPL